MNLWMSQLSNDTKLLMLWTKFDFHNQVDLFMELPISSLCCIWIFVYKYPRGPKEYNGDALHSCNRLFICLNSKFDELKEFHLLKKPPNFVQWKLSNIFRNTFFVVKQTLEKVRLNLCRKDALPCCNTLLLGSHFYVVFEILKCKINRKESKGDLLQN